MFGSWKIVNLLPRTSLIEVTNSKIFTYHLYLTFCIINMKNKLVAKVVLNTVLRHTTYPDIKLPIEIIN